MTPQTCNRSEPNADDYETAVRDFERGDTRPSSGPLDCLEAGCPEEATGRCHDCRDEYCGAHLHPIPELGLLFVCGDCRAIRIAESEKTPNVPEAIDAQAA